MPEDKKIVGYTTGVYDMFHIGHLKLLERAKADCNHLIVGVTTDELSYDRKSKRPIIPFAERIEIVRALRCVDEVVPQRSMDKVAAWETLRFNRMFVGDDWRHSSQWNDLEAAFAERQVEIRYFPYTPHVSSTKLRALVLELESR